MGCFHLEVEIDHLVVLLIVLELKEYLRQRGALYRVGRENLLHISVGVRCEIHSCAVEAARYYRDAAHGHLGVGRTGCVGAGRGGGGRSPARVGEADPRPWPHVMLGVGRRGSS